MGAIEAGEVLTGSVGRGAPRAFLIKTADYTVDDGDNGAVILADAVDLTITLPSTRAGFRVTVIVGTASATTGLSISPAAADQIIGNGFTPADNKDAINTAATDVVGDLITLVGDGVDGWYIESLIGTWAREA